MVVKAGKLKKYVEEIIENIVKKHKLGLDQHGELHSLAFDYVLNKSIMPPKHLTKYFKEFKKIIKKEMIKGKTLFEDKKLEVILATLGNAIEISDEIIKRLQEGVEVDSVTKEIMSLKSPIQTFVLENLQKEYPELATSIIDIINLPPKAYAFYNVMKDLENCGLSKYNKDIMLAIEI